ncbi:MAG: hypothetical protein VR65_25790 [Desulfobulbaceae bacterium BRH_c16a]|nr:MAG: hypothetical protein VR65_25790 [Desulfobulbaceae bacterium BRH_c16a]
MTAVFDSPVLTIVSQDLFGSGQLRSFTCNAVGEHLGKLTGFSVKGDTFNFEGLSNMRKVQMFIEFCGHPDSPDLFATVVGLVLGCMVRFPVDIFEK